MLINIYWLTPEFFISISLTLLLIFAVIYTKRQNKFSQDLKLNWLTIWIILISIFLYFNQIYLYQNVQISLGLLNITTLTIFIKIILCTTTVIILLLSKQTIILKQIKDFEYFILILLALLGMLLIISSNNLIIFYLSLELFSLSLYILAAINRQSEYSTEAGLKYFVLGSLSSGLLLFGCAILYVFTGEMNFENISSFIWYNNSFELIIGTMFIIIAILFKLAAAPFHMWAPDVYEGAPTIITAFFAIVPKLATIGVFINLIWFCFFGLFQQIQPIIIIASILSMLIGSIGALNQTKIKRLIAYSAISHIGFILLGILPGTIYSIQATIIYTIIYIIMSIASFCLILSIFEKTNYISELSGLSRKNPVLASTFALTLFSIAGIPPLAGFFSKYLILLEALGNNLIILAIIGVAASSIAAFYYIRIIKWMFFKDSIDFYIKDIADIIKPQINITINTSLILGVCLFFIITILFYPNYLINFIFEIIVNSLV